MRLIISAFRLLIALAPCALGAQAQTSPDSAIRAFLAAVAEQRWADAGRFVEPARVERERESAISHARTPARVRTVEDHLRHNPEMPRAVAEYFFEQERRSLALVQHMMDFDFADVTDTVMLRRLSPTDAAARYVQALDPRYGLRQASRMAPGCAGRPYADSAFTPRFEVLAGAIRGDTAWFMQRDTSRAGLYAGDRPQVTAVYRVGDRWYVDVDRLFVGWGSGALIPMRCDTTERSERRP